MESWPASSSRFDEQPGPQTQGHVGGKFNTNLSMNGIVVRPGDWDDYNIDYSGMTFIARGELWVLPFLGVGAKITGSPAMSNHTVVNGYAEPLIEDAKGLRYNLEGKLTYTPLAWLDFSVGYRYEDLYFEPPKPDNFSLAIIYAGPWVEAALKF
ncbi:MAG: hypothetical protein HGA76_05335 [Candidatus Firestonebacteria bacterium]|nr:hypothetical protein [Candidatus Firestonebacteria bacterium]